MIFFLLNAAKPIPNLFLFFLSLFGGRPCYSTHGILVPQPGMEPMPPAVEVWSLNHWTFREVLFFFFFFFSNLNALSLQCFSRGTGGSFHLVKEYLTLSGVSHESPCWCLKTRLICHSLAKDSSESLGHSET